MTVLVTGGNGFIGRLLVKELVKRGEDIVVFDVNIDKNAFKDVEDKVKLYKGDMASWSDVLTAVSENNIGSIYHLGSILSATGEAFPSTAFRVNVGGIFNVLEAARLFHIKKVIFTSTQATFGLHLPKLPPNETVQMPTTIYGITKVLGERLGEYYNMKFGVDFRGVRYPDIIGPGRGGGAASAYTSLIFEVPAKGESYEVCVEGRTKIPILYITDAVKALIQLHNAEEENLKRRVYNLAGISPTAEEMAETVRKLVPGAKITFKPDPEMQAIVDSWPALVDDTPARGEWRWKEKFDGVEKIAKEFINIVGSHDLKSI